MESREGEDQEGSARAEKMQEQRVDMRERSFRWQRGSVSDFLGRIWVRVSKFSGEI